MKYPISSRMRAFTLIEMLIVIAIIALITGIIMVNFTSSRSKARDGKRLSDIAQIQLALEQYFDRCNQYPPTLTGTLSSINAGCPTSPTQISLASFISTIPNAPTGVYDYAINSQGATPATNYVLHVTLENTNAAVKDGIPAASYPLNGWTVPVGSNFSCDNSATSLNYCIGPK